jgi:hypothetical protein
VGGDELATEQGSSACENVGKAKSKPGLSRVGALSTADRGRAGCPTTIGTLNEAFYQIENTMNRKDVASANLSSPMQKMKVS